MSLIVTGGMTSELAAWLEDRLSGVPVRSTLSGQEVLVEVAKGGCSLLIIDHGISGPSAPEVLRQIRDEPGIPKGPVIYCIPPDRIPPDMAMGTPGETGGTPARALAKRLAVDHVLVHPIDREELARQATRVLEALPDHYAGLGPVAAGLGAAAAGAKKQHAMSATMARIWERTKTAVINRVEVIEEATAALLEGGLDGELRQFAEGEAPKQGGLVGTFGYLEASRLAKEAERIFGAAAPLGQGQALTLSKLAVSLREELERPLDLGFDCESDQADKPPVSVAGPFFLVVDNDGELAGLVAVEAAVRGMRAEIAPDPDKAREIISRSKPGAVLLDLTFPEGMEDSLELLSELSGANPPVPVLVLTGRDTFIDRIEVARRGGRDSWRNPFRSPRFWTLSPNLWETCQRLIPT